MKRFLIIAVLFCSFACGKKDIIDLPPVVDLDSIPDPEDVDPGQVFDVVIYGGTMSGIMAAVEVVNSGKTAVLINPVGSSLGGVTTNGLGVTDLSNPKSIGGLSKEFYTALYTYYQNPSNWKYGQLASYENLQRSAIDGMMLWFEPKAAQTVMRQFLEKYKIVIIESSRLDLNKGVNKNTKKAITSITMESGLKIKGRFFIDATYEGDLMAKAGVKYTVGRESNSLYGETFNGIQRGTQSTSIYQFQDGIRSGSDFLRLPFADGTADNKVQAYCYRMCLTDEPSNRVLISKPTDYNESDYELVFSHINNNPGKFLFFNDFKKLPNNKTDSNNSGPISTDYVGQNYAYPDGDYVLREAISKKHKSYQLGLLWTLANHPKVPVNIRNYYKRWGLAKDEFTDNGNWPNQLYVREARRMISDYVMTERNCLGINQAPFSVGMADYPIDSHVVQRYVDEQGFIRNEGLIYGRVNKPYGIDYRSIIPSKSDCINLFVPICLSATHAAYGSIRMEPVFMTLGQSAACAAVKCLELNISSIQDLAYSNLKPRLESRNVVLSY
ncbi:FAD-dependent oxidoreductase [Sphingobacterium paramultivorum]|uniref:FAD-dependent oxidoreductase n=1 Tax=Sphingobacterium paramultivorum TaxID=2886510 RepID=A0A7G5E710_9SPHI|nr:FAD-dependent oxidoreductase [Sphingobacterium paramultivorum]QMV69785.1 FAD-dependent oxidoreductase [Sphingobacterium paramultivorum]WSO13610.1 FAD-dependent oxidoreductase [Sphingobacterium paramultivorum]